MQEPGEEAQTSAGPLEGVRVLELAAIGPAPFGVMLLADMGAEVVRVDRATRTTGGALPDLGMRGLSRGRRSIAVDLKSRAGVNVVLALADRSDVLVEGFRPGVAERLGLGPDVCTERNPRLVYARMTGWGQDGPLAATAGHDLDYAGVAGAIHPIGRSGAPPPPPLNFLADFAGGGCYLALGVVAALFERARSGRGQVIDAAMVDGVASLTAFFHGLMSVGAWTPERESNLLDGGAPFYDTYETADGKFMAVAALEPQFYAELLERLRLDHDEWPQHDRAAWPRYKQELRSIFASRTQREWESVFAGSDACVAPVLSLADAPDHPHLRAREVFVDVFGQRQPAPAPRLSRTPGTIRRPPPDVGGHSDEVLRDAGFDDDDIGALRAAGVVG